MQLFIRRVKHLLRAFLLQRAEEIVCQCRLLKSFQTLFNCTVLTIQTNGGPTFIFSHCCSIFFKLDLARIWCPEVISDNVLLILLAFFHHFEIIVVKFALVEGALHLDVAARLGGGAGTRFHCLPFDEKLFV